MNDFYIQDGFDFVEHRVPFKTILGKTIVSIRGLEAGQNEAEFICSDGTKFLMYHGRECCESVTIEDVVGDVSDLIGSPIVVAEENTSKGNDSKGYYTYTYTFYKLATRKGYVDIRWYGESNGYYSEDVDFLMKDNIKYVDLGLPSGTLWATCNVGANAPEDFGDYFTYDDAMALDCTLPNIEQIDELTNGCSRRWTTLNGVNGCLFTGPNGNTIFLPAWLMPESGLYWSCMAFDTSVDLALHFSINPADIWCGYIDHEYELPVRVVKK